MVTYVSSYNCSNWNSTVLVMNPQAHKSEFHIIAYDMSGTPVWQDIRDISPHETIRIVLDKETNKNGMVVVSPSPEIQEETSDEFPSMLLIADEGRSYKLGCRFAPFIRVP